MRLFQRTRTMGLSALDSLVSGNPGWRVKIETGTHVVGGVEHHCLEFWSNRPNSESLAIISFGSGQAAADTCMAVYLMLKPEEEKP